MIDFVGGHVSLVVSLLITEFNENGTTPARPKDRNLAKQQGPDYCSTRCSSQARKESDRENKRWNLSKVRVYMLDVLLVC
jgi:hypothetical protein